MCVPQRTSVWNTYIVKVCRLKKKKQARKKCSEASGPKLRLNSNGFKKRTLTPHFSNRYLNEFQALSESSAFTDFQGESLFKWLLAITNGNFQ